MDVIVSQTADGTTWKLTDLLGRSMGHILESPKDHFTIEPAGGSIETMAQMKFGPFHSLDLALAEIEKHTRGVCRREFGEDQL